MNMILHDYATAEIKQGNALANPLFIDGDALKTFDYVVANPPFSDKRWSTGLHPNEGGKSGGEGQQAAKDYGRFAGYGIPPRNKGDYAYLLHILRSIKPNGKGACGQTLRYMSYVQEELAEVGQTVLGAIVAHEDDARIRRALTMTPSISFYRYQVSFKLVKA